MYDKNIFAKEKWKLLKKSLSDKILSTTNNSINEMFESIGSYLSEIFDLKYCFIFRIDKPRKLIRWQIIKEGTIISKIPLSFPGFPCFGEIAAAISLGNSITLSIENDPFTAIAVKELKQNIQGKLHITPFQIERTVIGAFGLNQPGGSSEIPKHVMRLSKSIVENVSDLLDTNLKKSPVLKSFINTIKAFSILDEAAYSTIDLEENARTICRASKLLYDDVKWSFKVLSPDGNNLTTIYPRDLDNKLTPISYDIPNISAHAWLKPRSVHKGVIPKNGKSHSAIAVCIHSGEKPVGILCGTSEKRDFSIISDNEPKFDLVLRLFENHIGPTIGLSILTKKKSDLLNIIADFAEVSSIEGLKLFIKERVIHFLGADEYCLVPKERKERKDDVNRELTSICTRGKKACEQCVVTQVIAKKVEYESEICNNWDNRCKECKGKEKSDAAFPLNVKDEMWLLCFSAKRRHAFDDDIVSLVTKILNPHLERKVTHLIDLKDLRERIESIPKVFHLTNLVDIGEQIRNWREGAEEISRIITKMVTFPVAICFGCKYSEYRQSVEVCLLSPKGSSFCSASNSTTIAQQACKNKRLFIINNDSNDQYAELAIPLIKNDIILGVLSLKAGIKDARFSEREIHQISHLANLLAPEIYIAMTMRRFYSFLIDKGRLVEVGAITRGLLHQIGTFLTPIPAELDIMEKLIQTDLTQTPERGIKYSIQNIHRHYKKIIDFIEELKILLDPRIKPEFKNTNISNTIKRCLSIQNQDFLRHGIRIDNTQILEKPYYIKGNDSLLSILFLNLISNSINALSKLENLEASKEISFDIKEDKSNQICVSISDNGEGIEKSIVEEMNLTFKGTWDMTKHVGIGLSVCIDIMRRHKGFIEVESSPAKGTTFIIKFVKIKGAER